MSHQKTVLLLARQGLSRTEARHQGTTPMRTQEVGELGEQQQTWGPAKGPSIPHPLATLP